MSEPDHLEAVTPRENTMRGATPAATNTRLTHCKHGHPLSGGNLSISRDRNGKFMQRVCKACARARYHRGAARRRGTA